MVCLIIMFQKAFTKEQSEKFSGGKAVESSLKAYYKEFKKVNYEMVTLKRCGQGEKITRKSSYTN